MKTFELIIEMINVSEPFKPNDLVNQMPVAPFTNMV